MKRRTIAVLLAIVAVMLMPTAAVAAPPSNDDKVDAKAVPTLPFSETLNTEEATTEADEPESCAGERSVWYRITSDTDGGVVASTQGSNYSTSISVYEGSLSALTSVTCDYHTRSVSFEVEKGHTYFVRVSGIGYTQPPKYDLTFSLRRQPTVTALLDDRSWVALRNGKATFTGTATCVPAVQLQISVQVRQDVPGGVAEGSNQGYVACDEATPWQVTVDSSRDFRAGKVKPNVHVSAPSEDWSDSFMAPTTLVTCTQLGTLGNDEMIGTAGDDRICPLYGDDDVRAGAGDDFVYGNYGDDAIYAGRGNDVVFSSYGNDTVKLGPGNDRSRGGFGRDEMFGGSGDDDIDGEEGADDLFGGRGRDACLGGSGRDRFTSCEQRVQ